MLCFLVVLVLVVVWARSPQATTVFQLVGAFEKACGCTVPVLNGTRRPGDLASLTANVELVRGRIMSPPSHCPHSHTVPTIPLTEALGTIPLSPPSHCPHHPTVPTIPLTPPSH